MPAKKPLPKRRRARTFGVFEAGSGMPVGLFKKAASLRGRRRRFTGVEKRKIDGGVLEGALRDAGLKEIPRNVSWVSGVDALEEIAKVPRGSQSVVVASYFINNLPFSKGQKFLRRAKAALRPGGRILVADDKTMLGFYIECAKELEMGIHYTEIPDEKAAESDSESIRNRSNPEKRLERFRRLAKHGAGESSLPGKGIEEMLPILLKKGIVKSAEDMLHPTLFILRKTRPGENPPKPKIIVKRFYDS